MTICVKDIVIDVDSTFDVVYHRLRQFEVENQKTEYKIIIYDNLIDISVLDYQFQIHKKICSTDIYPILNNVLAYLINDENNLYIHSVVISKNNKGFLLLGDFKSGKTTFAEEAIHFGYEMNSADQTWITRDRMILGSSFNKIFGEVSFLNTKSIHKPVKIEKIFILRGLAKNGDFSIQKIDHYDYYLKNLFKYCNWHYDMPLLTEYRKLKDTGEQILEFLKKLNIEAYFISGDETKAMEVICDREESIK